MRPFSYTRADGRGPAPCAALAARPDRASLIAGGTNILDLMKENVARPARLIDITRLPLKAIEATPGRRAAARRALHERRHRVPRRGAQALPAALEGDTRRRVGADCATWRPTAAISSSARAAITSTTSRRRATSASRASGCGAIDGVNRMHAILGASEHVHRGASRRTCASRSPRWKRSCRSRADGRSLDPVRGFPPSARRHAAPRQHAAARRDHHGDRSSAARASRSTTRISRFATARRYAFALVSVAAALEMDGDTIREARIALGGVAHKPWRVPDAEALLNGAARERGELQARRRRVSSAAREATHTTLSRSSLRNAPSCARSRRP